MTPQYIRDNHPGHKIFRCDVYEESQMAEHLDEKLSILIAQTIRKINNSKFQDDDEGYEVLIKRLMTYLTMTHRAFDVIVATRLHEAFSEHAALMIPRTCGKIPRWFHSGS